MEYHPLLMEVLQKKTDHFDAVHIFKTELSELRITQ